MPDNPQLVVALETRLDKFEKQLKEAGVIAEREVKNIEDKFSRANPQFAGTFLGSFLGSASSQGMKALIGFIEDAINRFKDLEKVAKLVNIEMNELFGIQQAAAKFGAPIDDVTKSVRNLAELLNQMQRGEENSLSRLLDANPAALRGITRDALTLQTAMGVVADIIRNAPKDLDKVDIAKMAGQAESLVGFLTQGSDAITKAAKAAADAAPDLQKMANQAKELDAAWKQLQERLKQFVVEELSNFKLQLGEFIQQWINFLQIFNGSWLDNWANGGIRQLERFKNAVAGTFNDRFNAVFGESGPPPREQRAAGIKPDPTLPISKVPVRETGGGFDRFESAADRIEKRTAALEAETAAIDKGTEAREKAKIAAELETVAKQTNGKVTEEQRQRIDELASAYGRAAAAIEQARSPLQTFARESANINKQLNQFAATSLETVTSELAHVVTGTKSAADAFKAMATSIINDLAKIAIRAAITGPIARALGASLSGGSITPFPIFAPGNAEGTNSWQGGPTWVGERGPELINLPRGTQIIPNQIASKSGSMGGVTVAPVFNVDASGADPAAIARLEVALKATASSIEARALRAVNQHAQRYS